MKFRGEPSGNSDCYRCGGKHRASQCMFNEYECHFCKKKGHLATVCRLKKKETRNEPKIKNVSEPRLEQAN